MEYLVMIAVVIWVARACRAHLAKGFGLALTLMVALPTDLQIEMGGGLPQFTLHRVLLLVLAMFWIGNRRREGDPPLPSYLRWFVPVLIARGISMALSITPSASIKDLLGFAMETWIFSKIACSIIRDEESYAFAMHGLIRGLTIVAALAFLERYGDINLPVLVFKKFSFLDDGMQVTFPHRILFGYAMAMGMPLALAAVDLARTGGQRRWRWCAVLLLVSACYFSDSRGPWIGLGIATLICFAFSTAKARRRFGIVSALVVIVLVLRPGVRETIVNLTKSTFEQDTVKGSSYAYRWKLWKVAFTEIQKSPTRFLFGYGGLSTETMDLGSYFNSQEGGTITKLGYTSWDNQYASDLIEFGVIGLLAEALLMLTVLWTLFRRWRAAPLQLRSLTAGILAGGCVFLFAESNVAIFSAQLRFTFWTIAALGAFRLTPIALAEPFPDARSGRQQTGPLAAHELQP